MNQSKYREEEEEKDSIKISIIRTEQANYVYTQETKKMGKAIYSVAQ